MTGAAKSGDEEGRALTPGLGLGPALRHVVAMGAAVIHGALTDVGRESVLRDVADRTFEGMPPEIGPVRQETELLLISGSLVDVPSIAAVRKELVSAVRNQAPSGSRLDEWSPNEAYVQRYEPGSLGVSPHVDSKRFALLVAVFTLDGSAEFSVCEGRSGPVRERWTTQPGTLVLLRGPGLDGVEDGRPFHTVRGPAAGERYSLTFRMNTSGS